MYKKYLLKVIICLIAMLGYSKMCLADTVLNPDDISKYVSEHGFETKHFTKEENPMGQNELYTLKKDDNLIYIYCFDDDNISMQAFNEYYDYDKNNQKIIAEYNINGVNSESLFQAYNYKNDDNYYVYVLNFKNYLLVGTCDFENKKIMDDLLKKNELSIYKYVPEETTTKKHENKNTSSNKNLYFIGAVVIVVLIVSGMGYYFIKRKIK